MSRRGRRCGGGLVMDFWSPSSSAAARRLLRRRQEEGGGDAGAWAACLLRRAAGWWMPWSVQGLRLAAGRSGAAPRRRRPGRPDLEVEGELGARPRPACHSDRWAFMLLLVVHKAVWRWSFLFLGHGGCCPSLWRCFGVGGERRMSSGGAVDPEVPFVILVSFWGLPAVCTGLRILLDRISVCTYVVLHLYLN